MVVLLEIPKDFKVKPCPWCDHTNLKTDVNRAGDLAKWRCGGCESHGVITVDGFNAYKNKQEQ